MTRLILILIFGLQFISAVTLAQSAPSFFNYQGRLLESDGVTAVNGVVDFRFQIYDPSGACLLYEELQTNNTLSAGLFNLSIGSDLGSSKRTDVDPGLSMNQVFSNSSGVLRAAGSANWR
jgi:hypothetical protein